MPPLPGFLLAICARCSTPSAPADLRVTLSGTVITVKVKPGGDGGAGAPGLSGSGLGL